MLKKDYIWNHVTCCKNGKYLASIIDDSVITCDEILDAEAKLQDEETETIPTKFNGKNIAIKAKKYIYILLTLLLITNSFLIVVIVYCYVVKYKSKQKHL